MSTRGLFHRSPMAGSLPVLLFGVLAACAPAPNDDAAAAGAPRSRFGDYGPEPAPYDGRNRSSVYVPMKDGTQVAVDYYLPTSAGNLAQEPLPVVLHYTRYVRATEDEDGKLHTALDRDPILRHLSAHGYAIAVADARGTGASFGTNNGAFSPEETADSYTIIEWLASQPWSSGKVGMQGRSYPGMTQYEASTQAPPALRAIFAEMAGPTAYDFVFTNGTYKQDFVDQWGRLTKEMDLSVSLEPARVDADQDGALRDQAIAGHASNLWAHELMADPDSRFRNFGGGAPGSAARWSWDAIATIDDTDAIEASGVAIYHLVGWYDIYTTQQPFLFASLEGTAQKMMIGPWVHSGGYGGNVHKAEILRWYDHWLKGIDNGIMDEAPVHYFVMRGNHTLPAQFAGAAAAPAAPAGAETEPLTDPDETAAENGAAWIATREWPPAGATRQRFLFGAGKADTVSSINDGVLLSPADADSPAADAGTDRYRVDYTSTMGSFSRWMNGYGSRREQPARSTFFDERTAEDRKALTFTSPALAESLTLVGYPTVHLWLSSSHADGDVFVYLEEVDQAGAAHYVSEGALRASHRALAAAPFANFGLPYHRALAEDVAMLEPGQPAELVFSLEGTGIVIDAGHRIRITVAGADRNNYELYPDPKGVDAPTLTIHRGGEHASFIELPVMHGGEPNT